VTNAHPRQTQLLAELPKATGKALEKVLSDPKRSSKKLSAAFVKALQEASFPHFRSIPGQKLTELSDARARGVMPVPSELTPVQHALAQLLAYVDDAQLYFFDTAWQVFCLPETAANRRRWLGIDAGGVLEQPMELTVGNATRSVPTWHAVQRAAFTANLKAFFNALPVLRRLEVLGALFPAAYGLGFVTERPDAFMSFMDLKDEGAAWARAYADTLLGLTPEAWRASTQLRVVLFLAFARSGARIEPRWEPLFPLLGQPVHLPALRECLAGITPERREATVLAAMRDDTRFDTMTGALALLPDVPSAKLARTLLERAEANWLPTLTATLEALGARHADIRDVLNAFRSTQGGTSIALECGTPARPNGGERLSALQQKQLRAFGRAYDGDDLTAKQRLAPGRDVEQGSFAGELEIVPILDAKTRKTLYEAYLAIDGGSIFEAGTTTEVAAIVQGGLEQCKDPALQAALAKALAARPK
jgi:hypothetical protein